MVLDVFLQHSDACQMMCVKKQHPHLSVVRSEVAEVQQVDPPQVLAVMISVRTFSQERTFLDVGSDAVEDKNSQGVERGQPLKRKKD